MQRWNACAEPFGEAAFSPEEWDMLKGHIGTMLPKLEKRNIPTIFIGQGACIIRKNTKLRKRFGPWSDFKATFENHENQFMHLYGAFDFDLKSDSLVGYKDTPSAASIPGLREYLKAQGVKVIILSGWSEGHSEYHEECCVSQTAIDFADEFGVVIAADATNAALPSRWPEDLHAELPIVALEYRKRDFARFGVHIDPVDAICHRLDAAASRKEQPMLPVKEAPAQTLGTKECG